MNSLAMIRRCARGQALTDEACISLIGRSDIEATSDYIEPTDHGRDDVVPLGVEVP